MCVSTTVVRNIVLISFLLTYRPAPELRWCLLEGKVITTCRHGLLRVCLSALISQKPHIQPYQIFYACCALSCQVSSLTLNTSAFVIDIMFSYNGTYVGVTLRQHHLCNVHVYGLTLLLRVLLASSSRRRRQVPRLDESIVQGCQ